MRRSELTDNVLAQQVVLPRHSPRQGGQILHFLGSSASKQQQPPRFLGPPRLQSRIHMMSRRTQIMAYQVVPLLELLLVRWLLWPSPVVEFSSTHDHVVRQKTLR